MSGWQPISTFYERSDRTGGVLLYVPAYGVTLARCEYTGFHVWKSGEREFPGNDPKDAKLPTGSGPSHWMPLPDPPEEVS